jgi:hypothetical protein
VELYWRIVRPTVTYGCEAWVLKKTIKKHVDGMSIRRSNLM